MGFTLKCPNCGVRTYTEFLFGGEGRVFDLTLSEERDYGNVWLRANVAGPEKERWFHYAGCRRWITVTRDTRSNTILSQSRP